MTAKYKISITIDKYSQDPPEILGNAFKYHLEQKPVWSETIVAEAEKSAMNELPFILQAAVDMLLRKYGDK